MIYERPVCYAGGDSYIEVELGDEMSFDLNIAVHGLCAAIQTAAIAGVVELIPELASLQVSYDPDRIAYADVVAEILAIHGRMGDAGDQQLDSRLFEVPVLYGDPWTGECIDDYRKSYPDKTPDTELLCRLNGLPDARAFQRRHASTEYWVAALGFWPGLCSLMPLDPRALMVAPKYNPPRTWTPKGAIGIGGGLSCIYPDRTPGGYQLFARTPMPTWDREARLPAFRASLALFQAGDRVRFLPVDRYEYDLIDAEVAAGTYKHPNVDYQVFSVTAYRRWRESVVSGEAT